MTQKQKDNIKALFSDEDFITNVCLSYRHDYGLMSDNERNLLRFECKEWMRAIANNWENKRTHVFPKECEHISYRQGHSPFVPCICNDCGQEL